MQEKIEDTNEDDKETKSNIIEDQTTRMSEILLEHDRRNEELISSSTTQLMDLQDTHDNNIESVPDIGELLTGSKLRSQQFWSIVKFRFIVAISVPWIPIFRYVLGFCLML